MSEHNKNKINISNTNNTDVFILPELNLIPYKNSNKTSIKKYHIIG